MVRARSLLTFPPGAVKRLTPPAHTTEYGITNFPSDSTKLAEMEFCQYQVDQQQLQAQTDTLRPTDLIEDLEFHLIVYHPYRSLVHMTGRDSGPVAIRESMLEMEDNQLQVAW